MTKYFRIGEISELFGIGADSIRYYEELGIIRPSRGENGYRLYSAHDIWRINVIRDLRSLGFSMERIREYLENRTVESTIGMLSQEISAITERLAALEKLRGNLENRLAIVREARERPEGEVTSRTYPDRRCHIIRESYHTDEEMDILMQRLLRIDHSRLYIIGNNRIGSRLDAAAVAAGGYRRYSAVFIIDKNGGEVIEGGEYLTVAYRGSPDKNAVYVPMLMDCARRRNLRPVGDILELLLIDIHESADFSEHINELQVRVV